MLNCPRDNNSLTFINNDSWTFSYCKKCGGIWIAGKDILTSISIDSEDYLDILVKKWIRIDKKPENQISCNCDTKLVTLKVQKTFIDVCPACKWTRFDNGELAKIIKSIKDEKPSVMKALKEFGSINYIAHEKNMIKIDLIWSLLRALFK